MEIRNMGILFLLLFSVLVSWPMHLDGRLMAGESLNDMKLGKENPVRTIFSTVNVYSVFDMPPRIEILTKLKLSLKRTILSHFEILVYGPLSRAFRAVAGKCIPSSFTKPMNVVHILLDCGLDPKMIPALNKLDLASHDIILDSTQCKRKLCMILESWELKQRIFDCLIKHSFQETRADKTQNRFTKVPASFNMLRRNLADIPVPTISPSPAPIPAPTFSQSPAPVLTPLSPGPALLAPALRLGPAPILAPSSSSSSGPALKSPYPAPTPFYIENTDVVSPSPTPISKSPQISEDPRSHDNNRKFDVTVIVLSASAAALVIAFLIFCCCRCARNTGGPDIGRKDERPLLTLSWSDFFGSPYSSGFSSSVQKEKVIYSSVKTESGMNGHVVTINNMGLSPAPESNADILPPLKPPPGRPMAAPTPAPPPLPPITKLAPPPPPLPKAKPSPPPPPPPKGAASLTPPQASSINSKVPRPSPLGPNRLNNADADDAAPKIKLKPLFWDKVSPNPEKSMVWNEIKSGSFQFNEEMIETLFGYSSDIRRKADRKNGASSKDPAQLIQLLDTKKSQNLAISLKALSIKADVVVDALMEGNELPQELLQSLLRMAPTSDEELKIRLYSGDLSLLGPGEQFLKAIVDIPYAFKRMEALLFIFSLPEDTSSIKQSFSSLEVACKELKSSRLFLKLLEAVLKLGNRMNDGTFRGGAQAFKLDTLLKLSDVKGVDGKTTLLHFVVQEIIKSEGARAIRLGKETDDSSQEIIGLGIVSSLSSELDNVKKAAALDAEALTTNLSSLDHKLTKTEAFLNTEMKSSEEDSGFHRLLKSFVEHAQVDVTFLLEEEKRIKALVKSTTDYFHGNSGRDEGLRLFVIVRDFLNMIDKACKEVSESAKVMVKVQKNNNLLPNVENQQHLFPAIRDHRVDSSSSDEEKS